MITAIISEFNPITNGHEYIIKKAKESGDFVLCLQSGNFVQRGDVAILPKHLRAKMAILAGADLVIELPVQFSLSSAETFAEGAVRMLSKIPALSAIYFGSECGDISILEKQAEFFETDKFKKHLKRHLKKGDSFPLARKKACDDCGVAFSTTPNDTLGVEYIKAIKKYNLSCAYKTTKRLGAHDSSETFENFASASYIRELLFAGDYSTAEKFMPKSVFPLLQGEKLVSADSLAVISAYQGIFGKHRDEISEVSEGLHNLFFQTEVSSFEKYTECIKSKRYTHARVKRACMKNILHIRKKDVEEAKSHISFAKVLAVSKDSTKQIFALDFGKLVLIKRKEDYSLLGKKQRKILKKMNDCDLLYSILSGSSQHKMEVVEKE